MDIILKNVSRSYQGYDGSKVEVIKDLSIEMKKGSVLRLKGPSGSGKTTLMNMISGLILPDSGSVTVNGVEISGLHESARDSFRAGNIGYIFQTFNLLSPFSVIENVYAPLAFAGKLPENYRQKALDILNEVGLTGLENRRPYHLSVGQRQRVSVARVLFLKPAVILADEPTASLDAVSAKTVYDSISKCRDNGSTIVLASHDTTFDGLTADAVLDLETGRVS
ncbi:MAG TPA: ABC transporter ATP-binding protein [bacterium]|nr:ABC transporter ATP-binding protein [bacterium]